MGISAAAENVFWMLCKHNIQTRVITLSIFHTNISTYAKKKIIMIYLQKKVRDRKGNPLPSQPVASDLDVASEQIQNLIPSQSHTDPCKGSFFIF